MVNGNITKLLRPLSFHDHPHYQQKEKKNSFFNPFSISLKRHTEPIGLDFKKKKKEGKKKKKKRKTTSKIFLI